MFLLPQVSFILRLSFTFGEDAAECPSADMADGASGGQLPVCWTHGGGWWSLRALSGEPFGRRHSCAQKKQLGLLRVLLPCALLGFVFFWQRITAIIIY